MRALKYPRAILPFLSPAWFDTVAVDVTLLKKHTRSHQESYYVVPNPAGAEVGIFHQNEVSTMAADTLATWVARTSAVMVLTICERGFQEEGFDQPTPIPMLRNDRKYQYAFIICFLKPWDIKTNKGLHKALHRLKVRMSEVSSLWAIFRIERALWLTQLIYRCLYAILAYLFYVSTADTYAS